jgi:Leucine-rich repeat (LRR) protein
MSRRYPKIDDSLDEALDEDLHAPDLRVGRTTSAGDPAIAPDWRGRQVTAVAAEARLTALQNVVSGAAAGQEGLVPAVTPAPTTRPMAPERTAPVAVSRAPQQQPDPNSTTAPSALGGRQMTTMAAQARVTALQNVITSVPVVDIRRVATDATRVPPPPASAAMASAPACLPSPGDNGDAKLLSEKALRKNWKDRLQTADSTKSMATGVDRKTIGPDEKVAEGLVLDDLHGSPGVVPPPRLQATDHHTQPGAFRFSTGRGARRVVDDSEEGESYMSLQQGASYPPTEHNQRQETLLLEATLVDGEYPTAPVASPPTSTNALVTSLTLVDAQPATESEFRVGRTFLLTGLLILVAVAGVIGAVVATQLGGGGSDDGNVDKEIPPGLPTVTSSPTTSPPPTVAPTDLSRLEELRQTLPRDTLLALADPTTFQSRAFDWLSESPSLTEYSLARRRQLFAMVSFFFATAGPRWSIDSFWLDADVPECSWYSTYSDLSNTCLDGVLQHLSIFGNFLNGEFPEEVALLEDLVTVDLPENRIHGTFPPILANLTNLVTLDLEDNFLTGPLPPGLGALSEMRTLNLSFQAVLSGPLPADAFEQWSEMQMLDLSRNMFGDGLPTEIAQMSKLEYLYLYYNILDGPLIDEIGQLSNLVGMFLYGNEFTGTIPSSWASLTSLEILDVSQNNLFGSVPPELCALVDTLIIDCNLVECDCGCECGDSISPPTAPPVSFPTEAPTIIITQAPVTPGSTSFPTRAPTLLPTSQPTSPRTNSPLSTTRLLNFRQQLPAYTQVQLLNPASPQSEALTWLGDNANIDNYDDLRLTQRFVMATLYYATTGDRWTFKDGWLSDNNECTWFSRSSFPCTGQTLTFLLLQELNLLGTIPAEIGMLTLLSELSLDRNRLRGTIPTTVGLLENLVGLWLFENLLTGNIPTEVGALAQLEILEIDDNLLNGSLPSEMSSLAVLREVWVSGNELTGTIPSWLGSLLDLEVLYLSFNSMQGNIPASLANLSLLEAFETDSLGLEGDFPQNLWNAWPDLFYLSIGFNLLRGTIGTGIGALSLLNHIDIYANEFSGEIPTEVGMLGSATIIFMEDNFLVGNIPSEFAAIPNLELLHMYNNFLSGSVPDELCDRVRFNGLELAVDCDVVSCDCACDCSFSS